MKVYIVLSANKQSSEFFFSDIPSVFLSKKKAIRFVKEQTKLKNHLWFEIEEHEVKK